MEKKQIQHQKSEITLATILFMLLVIFIHISSNINNIVSRVIYVT